MTEREYINVSDLKNFVSILSIIDDVTPANSLIDTDDILLVRKKIHSWVTIMHDSINLDDEEKEKI